MRQSTSNILLIKPSNFVFNDETAISNAFQQKINHLTENEIKEKVITEFNLFAKTLQTKGVNVFVFDDTDLPPKPDAIFPNNWITFHADGTVILYPMQASSRRHERRIDIIQNLKKYFSINKVIDISHYEQENKFLEGTGSIIFDHKNKIAYACLSPRTDKELFIEVSTLFKYQPVFFHSYDKVEKEIYHTNVMMCIGDAFAIICTESITNKNERAMVIDSLQKSGHEIIDITLEQVNHFAGNMLVVLNNEGKQILIKSQSAFDSLTDAQKKLLGQHCELLPIPITTIETIGGGSARCMMAEIFCPRV